MVAPHSEAQNADGDWHHRHENWLLTLTPGYMRRVANPLGLVTKTLLVAVGLKTLFALMLVDFRLTTFFERSHNGCWF